MLSSAERFFMLNYTSYSTFMTNNAYVHLWLIFTNSKLQFSFQEFHVYVSS
jgi:hypothetical protein